MTFPHAPNLLLVGAMRSGTTSAYRYLQQHPDVFMSTPKEPMFLAFDGRTPHYTGPGDTELMAAMVTDREAYEAIFVPGAHAPVRGEASTHYLYLPQALDGIAKYCPDAHVVAILRDPVARAHSSFLFQRARGKEPSASFEQALAEEEERIAAGWQPLYHYRRAGRYGEQLARFVDAIPADQLHVVLHDDLEREGQTVLNPVLRALGVAEFPPAESVVHNGSGRSRYPWLERLLRPTPAKVRLKHALPRPLYRTADAAMRSLDRWRSAQLTPRAELDPATAAELRASYAADVARTEELIGRDLSAWR